MANINIKDFKLIEQITGSQKGGKNIGKEVKATLNFEIKNRNFLIKKEVVGIVIVNQLIITTKCLDVKDTFLSHPAYIPNTTYKFTHNNVYYIIIMDNLGRRTKVIAKYKRKNTKINKKRINKNQSKSLIFFDGDVPRPSEDPSFHIYNDQGGHIFPHSAGGTHFLINIFPQAHILNNSPKWKAHEKITKKLIEKTGKVKLIVDFTYEGSSKRPKLISRKHVGNKDKEDFDNINKT